MNMDLYLFNIINQWAGKWLFLDEIAVFCAVYLGYILVVASIGLLFFSFKKWKKIISFAFLSALLSRFVIVEIIRYFFFIDRPFVSEKVNLLIQHSATPSFPSGHASFYFALAGVIFLKNKKIGSLFFLSAFLISFSRVFVGVHWVSDILAGFGIGTLLACGVYKNFLQDKK